MRRLMLLVLLSLVTPFRSARPDLITTITTTGSFSCGGLISVGSCLAAGNVLTLTNGGSTVLFNFTGFTGLVDFDTQTGVPFTTPLGTIDEIASGANPIFPLTSNLNEPLFRLLLTLSMGGSSRTWLGGAYQSADRLSLSLQSTNHYIAFGNFPESNKAAIFTQFTDPTLTARTASVSLLADAVVVPEPSTLVLLATGLGVLGLGGAARRRKAS